jgi:(1->4)-alpha-D-glucan 1-alpha-D-glucosylmutase
VSAVPEFRATYRLQLGPDLDFAAAAALIPYLRNLGISHLYLSPVMEARKGSTHGYDVVDPTRVSDALGGEAGLRALAAAGLPIIVDFVPNHMAATDDNPFWRDHREQFFDIDPETGAHRRFFDVDELAGVRVEDPEVFATTHATLLALVRDGIVEGVRVDHVDGLADPAEYLRRLRAEGVEHVWIEKILEPGEPLRPWPIEGTTGYEFLNDALQVFVDPRAEDAFAELAGEARPFAELAYEAKSEQARTTFAREIDRLRRIVDTDALVSGVAAMPVYRTYIEPESRFIDDFDREVLRELPESLAVHLALEVPTPPEFVTRFQQTSGAIMAKGVEDTACYRYMRLVALNEVGGDPSRFGLPVDAFHAANAARLRATPRALLAAQTHDAKRSLDVRSRLVALTHDAEAWVAEARAWHLLNAEIEPGAPAWPVELFLYQTLVGAWPISGERLEQYLMKAMREAKRETNWITPDEQWEARLFAFARAVIEHPAFLARFEPFVDALAFAGERISLGQVVLRCTAPGVPDTYQGDDNWDFSLVDPDNRRPVDWEYRRTRLDQLRSGAAISRDTAKLFTLHRLLTLRAERPDAFADRYEPLDTTARAVAFRRGDDVVVVVPLAAEPAEIDLPAGAWRDVLAPLAAVYGAAPAVFVRDAR